MMARNVAAACVAALALSALGGCGTVDNLKTDAKHPSPSLYGGVFFDTHAAQVCVEPDREGEHRSWRTGIQAAEGAYALLIDLPLSAVGDTLALPYILWLNPDAHYPSDCISNFDPARLMNWVEQTPDKPTQ
jgi:uncharacterized protein YceK